MSLVFNNPFLIHSLFDTILLLFITGLLLFTNDELIMNKFTNSKNGVVRLFHMELDKPLKFEHLKSTIWTLSEDFNKL